MLLRVFVCLLFTMWVVVQNIMDFVDLYEGANRIFPNMKGGKYQYARIRWLRFSAVFTSIPFLFVITMCVYPSCEQWLLILVDAVYIVIYIFMYFVVKAKRTKMCAKDNNYVVIKVEKSKNEMPIADKQIYDVFLKDAAGNIITIKTIDAYYYEEKMRAGKMIKISKKRH